MKKPIISSLNPEIWQACLAIKLNVIQWFRYPVVPDNLPNDKFVGVIGDKVIVQQRHSKSTPSARKKVCVTNPTDKTARRRLFTVYFVLILV